MKNYLKLKLLLSTAVFLLNYSFAFAQWEFVGAPSIGEVISLKSRGDTLFSLTNLGLYYNTDSIASWKLVPGSNQFGYIDGFIVHGENIYLYKNSDYSDSPRFTVIRSQNLGANWKTIYTASKLSYGNNCINAKGDTLILGINSSIILSTDAGDTFESYDIDFDYREWDLTPLNHFIYIYDNRSIKKVRINTLDTIIPFLPEIAKFPEGQNFLSMHISEKNVWFLFEKAGKVFLYKLSEDQNELILATSFIANSPNNPYVNKLGSYKDKIFVQQGYGTENKVIFTLDEGITFKETEPIPYKFLGFIGQQIFTAQNMLLVTTDLGHTFNDFSKGIFSPHYLHFADSDANVNIFYEKGYFDKLSFTQNESGWAKIDELKDLIWVKNSSGTYLALKKDSLIFTSDLSKPFEKINQIEVKSGSKISACNNFFYIFNANGNWISRDNCKTWDKLNIGFNTGDATNSISYNEGFYVLSCIKSIWISSNGIDFEDVSLNLSIFASSFYQNNKVYSFGRNNFEVLDLKTKDWVRYWYKYHIPFIYNVDQVLIPLGDNLIGWSTIHYGFYVSADEGNTWIDANEGLDVKFVFDSKKIGEYSYCINTTGVWKRKISELYRLVNSNDYSSINRINIYPNPATNSIHIVSGTGDLLKQISLFDSAGSLIMEYKGKSEDSATLDVSHLSQGIYFAQIVSSGQMIMKKVFINN